MAEEEAFIAVPRRRAARARPTTKISKGKTQAFRYQACRAAAATPPRDLVAAVRFARSELAPTALCREVLQRVRTFAKSRSVELICYGLGSLMESAVARAQVALLLELYHSLGLVCYRCRVHDPVLTAEDKALAGLLGLEVMESNDLGRLCLAGADSENVVVLYMPHCPLELYNNVLWAHWWPAVLPRLAIVGNSFAHYSECLTTRELRAKAGYLHRALPLAQETLLDNACSPFPEVVTRLQDAPKENRE